MTSGRRWTAGVALVVGFLAWLFFLSPLVEFGLPVTLAGLLVVGVVIVVFLRRRMRTSDDDREESTVWDAIPSWQYGGRHVESGGLTRDEQERALQDVQEEAAKRRGEQ